MHCTFSNWNGRSASGSSDLGGDVAIPLRWLTLKAEAAHFSSTDSRPDQYALYVLQLERQVGEWFFRSRRRCGDSSGMADFKSGSCPFQFNRQPSRPICIVRSPTGTAGRRVVLPISEAMWRFLWDG